MVAAQDLLGQHHGIFQAAGPGQQGDQRRQRRRWVVDAVPVLTLHGQAASIFEHFSDHHRRRDLIYLVSRGFGRQVRDQAQRRQRSLALNRDLARLGQRSRQRRGRQMRPQCRQRLGTLVRRDDLSQHGQRLVRLAQLGQADRQGRQSRRLQVAAGCRQELPDGCQHLAQQRRRKMGR